MLGAFRSGELLESGAAAAAGGASCGDGAVFGDDEDVEAAEGLGVAGEGAVGGGDEDAAQLFAVAGAHLHDARIVGAGGAVGAQDQLEARGEVEVEAAERHGVEIGRGGLGESLHGLLRGAGGDERGGARGVEKALGAEVVGIGVAGALAGEDADAAAGADALAGGFDDLLVDAQRGGGNRLKIKVGVVAAGGESLAQAALEQPLGDAELLKEITSVADGGGNCGIGHRSSSLRPARLARRDGWGRLRGPFPVLVRAISEPVPRGAMRVLHFRHDKALGCCPSCCVCQFCICRSRSRPPSSPPPPSPSPPPRITGVSGTATKAAPGAAARMMTPGLPLSTRKRQGCCRKRRARATFGP